MSEHTPGPWTATTRKGSWDWLVAKDASNEICQMFHDGTEFNETGEANAHLVAAAPGLLEALRIFVDDAYVETPDTKAVACRYCGYRTEVGQGHIHNLVCRIAIAEAAIAEAEGRQ